MSEMEKQNQTTGYSDKIKCGYSCESNLSHFHRHVNAKCIVCGALKAEMIRVGAVIFCDECVHDQFISDDPVRKERDLYLHWLHKSHKESEE